MLFLLQATGCHYADKCYFSFILILLVTVGMESGIFLILDSIQWISG